MTIFFATINILTTTATTTNKMAVTITIKLQQHRFVGVVASVSITADL